MTNLHNPAAATESLIGSVAAAAIAPSATPAQREAALKFLASVVNIGSPATAAPAPAVPAPVATPAAPFAAPAPVLTPVPANAVASPSFSPWTAGTLYPLVPTSYVTQGPSPDNGELWYAVLKGKSVGLTQNNAVALHAVVGVSNNQMKSFKSLKKALFAFNHALDIGLIEIRPF